jgi:hypothetical protein
MFAIFKEQRELLGGTNLPVAAIGEALCMQIRLGNRDIVELLLKMRYYLSGLKDYRPMRKAAILNNAKVFHMLRDYGGQIESYPEWPCMLLYDLASRLAFSPLGILIAEELIATRVLLNDYLLDIRLLVVKAILNSYYNLANLLIQNRV